jgi:predicted PurR-regulated permease PerM
MKKVRIGIFIIFLISILLSIPYTTFAKDMPFTQEDRDRIIAMQEGQKSLQKQIDYSKINTNRQIDALTENMNKRFENIDRQFSDIKTFIMWGDGVLFSMMVSLAGFVLWDRRNVLTPAIRRSDYIEEREKKIESALRELAGNDASVAEALRHAGIL